MSRIESFRIVERSDDVVVLEISITDEAGDFTGVTAHLLDGNDILRETAPLDVANVGPDVERLSTSAVVWTPSDVETDATSLRVELHQGEERITSETISFIAPDVPWDCDDKRVRVSVKQPSGVYAEIPTVGNPEEGNGGVECHVRKEGSASINRVSEVYFPETWHDVDVLQYIPDYDDPNRGLTQSRVEFRQSNDEWVTIHHGFVRSIGPAAMTRVQRLWIHDWSELLDGIPVSKSFEEPTDVDVLEFVIEQIHERTPLSNIEAVGMERESLQGEVDDEDIRRLHSPNGIIERLRAASPMTNPQGSVEILGDRADTSRDAEVRNVVNTEFQSNRHTLTDVLEWLCEITESRWWFDYDDENDRPILAYDTPPHATTAHYDTHIAEAGDSSLRIINNTALEDAKPINAVRVNGDSTSWIDGVKKWKQNVPSGEYPTATAAYKPLIERAGGVFMSRPYEDQAKSIEAIENEATSTLKEQLSAPTLGEMTVFGRVSIQPGDIIYALPVCNERRPVDAAEMRPLAYEVERVTHGKPPTRPYIAEISASFATRDEDIVFLDEDFEETTGGYGAEA